jgi:hypothetical protein
VFAIFAYTVSSILLGGRWHYVDQALAGIDMLLRSQELTIAVVGVAPALSLVYAIGGYFGRSPALVVTVATIAVGGGAARRHG